MDQDKQQRVEALSVKRSTSVLSALKRMDALQCKLLIVTEKDHFFSLLSIGDVQRAIIRNLPLDRPIEEVLRPSVRVARVGEGEEVIRQRMLEFRTECMPVLDVDDSLVDIYFWEDLFEGRRLDQRLQCPVVVMAGGRGERLRPLTNILPKPLVPLGDKPVLETILDSFHEAGASRFFVTVNYKHRMISDYLAEANKPYVVTFVKEDTPLGTAGSLHLLRGQIQEPFFVSNCDIVVDQDYVEVLEYHRESGNEITLVAALRHYHIPYGTIETGNGGILERIDEKPELTFKINTGLYVLQPRVLDEVPAGQAFDLTDLIEAVRARNGRVGVFPVSENAWFDIGQWTEYQHTVKAFQRRFGRT